MSKIDVPRYHDKTPLSVSLFVGATALSLCTLFGLRGRSADLPTPTGAPQPIHPTGSSHSSRHDAQPKSPTTPAAKNEYSLQLDQHSLPALNN